MKPNIRRWPAPRFSRPADLDRAHGSGAPQENTHPSQSGEAVMCMESAFVLDCLTSCLFPGRPWPIPALELNKDWLDSLLVEHGLVQLFAGNGGEYLSHWPRKLREHLRDGRLRALLRGDRCVKRVEAVLAALNRVGIPVIVLKGWAKIPTLYGGDYGQRIYADIDLLVRPQDAVRAEQSLHDLGCRADPEVWPGSCRRYHSNHAFEWCEDARTTDGWFAVGVHWALLDTPFYWKRIPVETLFEHSHTLRLVDHEVARLCPEDDLVYACGHLALHHNYDETLLRYYEMAAIIVQAGSSLDWRAVVARARSWRLVVPVRRVFAHLEGLWPGIIPALPLAEISALQPTRSELLVHHWVLTRKDNHTVRAILTWLTLPGLGRRCRYVLEHALPSQGYMRQRYGPAPGGIWPLLYLQRLQLASRYLASIIARRTRETRERENDLLQ